MPDIADTLKERGKFYGDFEDQALIGQRLKNEVREHWFNLAMDQREAVEMFCTKIARILNGDPDYIDNWDDISGYATLIADRLRRDKK